MRRQKLTILKLQLSRVKLQILAFCEITVILVSKSTQSKSGHHQSIYEKPSVVIDFHKIYAVYQIDEK